jgi:large subunit ribosomal protein L4
MAQIAVYSKEGKEIEQIELNPEVFDAKLNKRLLDMVVRLFANNKRTGNAHTKTRAEVRGGGKRPWRQKGTGRARSSSNRNPLWRGGGTVFGPRTRDIYYAIPKKMRSKALIAALTKKYKDARIMVVDDLSVTSAKTKEFFSILKSLKIDERKTLLISDSIDDVAKKATRNIKNLSLVAVSDVNAYNVMRKNFILLDPQAIKSLEERVLKANINSNAELAESIS